MDRTYKFSVVQLPSHPLRGERLNVGVFVCSGDKIEARYPHRLDKIKAISGAIDPDDIRFDLGSLAKEMTANNVFDTFGIEAFLGDSVYCVSQQGTFYARSSAEYEFEVQNLIEQFVLPEPAAQKSPRKRSTQLKSSVKNAFKEFRVLAGKGDRLEDHRIISNQMISSGIIADFVLKNGAMHIVEVVDAENESSSLKKIITDIAVSALTFEHARMAYVGDEVRPQLVYQSSAQFENIISPSLYAAQHQGAELVNWSSEEQRLRFVRYLSSCASPIERKSTVKILNVNASIQSRFSIN